MVSVFNCVYRLFRSLHRGALFWKLKWHSCIWLPARLDLLFANCIHQSTVWDASETLQALSRMVVIRWPLCSRNATEPCPMSFSGLERCSLLGEAVCMLTFANWKKRQIANNQMTKFHVNSSEICWAMSVWTKVDRPTNQQSDVGIDEAKKRPSRLRVLLSQFLPYRTN